MARKTLTAQEQKFIQFYRELSDKDQQKATNYLEGLAKKELEKVKRKIQAIQENLIASKGLTRREVDIAAQAGLIDKDQRWWWMEEWQAGEREAEEDIQAGRVKGPMTVEELIKELNE